MIRLLIIDFALIDAEERIWITTLIMFAGFMLVYQFVKKLVILTYFILLNGPIYFSLCLFFTRT